jgi:phosphate transport system ATP-binding protein
MNVMSELQTEAALTRGANAPVLKMRGEKVNVFYGQKQALFDVDLDIYQNEVTASPPSCAASTG